MRTAPGGSTGRVGRIGSVALSCVACGARILDARPGWCPGMPLRAAAALPLEVSAPSDQRRAMRRRTSAAKTGCP